jgi:hypothetical protein
MNEIIFSTVKKPDLLILGSLGPTYAQHHIFTFPRHSKQRGLFFNLLFEQIDGINVHALLISMKVPSISSCCCGYL